MFLFVFLEFFYRIFGIFGGNCGIVQWNNGDDGPDWGDLKHNEKEPEPTLKKVKEVGHTCRNL